jgi:hypothetical protein
MSKDTGVVHSNGDAQPQPRAAASMIMAQGIDSVGDLAKLAAKGWR